MRLTKSEFCEYIDTYEKMLTEESEAYDSLHVYGEWVGMGWVNNYYNLFHDMCELKENEYMGTLVDWYCFETEFGYKNPKLTVNEEEVVIKNPSDLYDYIMEHEV